mmetsp:Transcript_65126/g.128803  ORF Transcript_65126/g.128803 Transcript_65126/m.128803 type:complete len:190 (-) Transcript_65126:408-977(-)
MAASKASKQPAKKSPKAKEKKSDRAVEKVVASAALSTETEPVDDVDTEVTDTVELDIPEGIIRELWCSGDEPNSKYQHNFEGSWNLSESEPMINGHPHYDHQAPIQWIEEGEAAPLLRVHLFFSGSRWVIGPTPSNDSNNGWAYTDSLASDPADIVEPWVAWSKEKGAWGEARLAFKQAEAPVSLKEMD